MESLLFNNEEKCSEILKNEFNNDLLKVLGNNVSEGSICEILRKIL